MHRIQLIDPLGIRRFIILRHQKLRPGHVYPALVVLCLINLHVLDHHIAKA
jgi:hypothetical protein